MQNNYETRQFFMHIIFYINSLRKITVCSFLIFAKTICISRNLIKMQIDFQKKRMIFWKK